MDANFIINELVKSRQTINTYHTTLTNLLLEYNKQKETIDSLQKENAKLSEESTKRKNEEEYIEYLKHRGTFDIFPCGYQLNDGHCKHNQQGNCIYEHNIEEYLDYLFYYEGPLGLIRNIFYMNQNKKLYYAIREYVKLIRKCLHNKGYSLTELYEYFKLHMKYKHFIQDDIDKMILHPEREKRKSEGNLDDNKKLKN